MLTSHPGRQDGFTLLEIIVVLILLGAAAAVVIPSFSSGLSGLTLETASRDVVTRMRQARVDAVARQQVFRVILNTDPEPADTYALADEYGRILKSYDLPNGIFLKIEDESPRTISFYPNGRSSGGEFGLRDEKGREKTIVVDPITGFGKVQDKRQDMAGR